MLSVDTKVTQIIIPTWNWNFQHAANHRLYRRQVRQPVCAWMSLSSLYCHVATRPTSLYEYNRCIQSSSTLWRSIVAV